MGVGVQREGGAGVPEDAGKRLDVNSRRQSVGGKGMPKPMKLYGRQPRFLQDFSHMVVSIFGTDRLLRMKRVREYPLRQSGLLSFPKERCRAGRQDDLPCAGVGLGAAGSQPAALFALDGSSDMQGSCGFIEVLPLESADLTAPQAGHHFHGEKVTPDLIVPDGGHEDVELLVCQNLFLPVAELWSRNLLCWVAGDQVFPPCSVQDLLEHTVDAAYGAAGQSRLLSYAALPG